MHALASRIDERPFDMDSERARHAFMRLARGGQRCVKHARRVGHDRRQESGHASAPMRGGNRRNPLDGRIGVEQHAAAAIDLPIDEAGAKNPPPRSTCSPPRGRSSKRVSETIEAPSTTSAQSSCSRSPSKIRAPVKTFIARLPVEAPVLRRDDAANEQDRPVGRIVERRREPRGDIGLEIATQGFAHAPDQRDPFRAKRDHAARQRADGARCFQRDLERDRIKPSRVFKHTRREGAEISRLRLERPIHHRHRIAAEFGRDCRQSARSPAQGRHGRASRNAAPRGRCESPIRRRRARIRARQ